MGVGAGRGRHCQRRVKTEQLPIFRIFHRTKEWGLGLMRRDELLPGEWRFRRPRPSPADSDGDAASQDKRRRGATGDRELRHESLTPAQRVMRSRMAAYLLHARYDSRQTTTASHGAFMARFLDEVDPEHKLPEPERRRRAAAAKSACFTRLAYLSAIKRGRGR
jgi:hypothetical protein